MNIPKIKYYELIEANPNQKNLIEVAYELGKQTVLSDLDPDFAKMLAIVEKHKNDAINNN
jgi:hypothetical protein